MQYTSIKHQKKPISKGESASLAIGKLPFYIVALWII